MKNIQYPARILSFLTILSIALTQFTPYGLLPALAQDIPTETPTLIPTDTETPLPPSETPVPIETAAAEPQPVPPTETPTPEQPSATSEMMPTLEPSATETLPYTETPIETATETPTVSLEPTFTPTATLLPGEFLWQIVMDVPISRAELSDWGGINNAEVHLENSIENQISDGAVESSVDPLNTSSNSATYRVTLSGTGGLDQFRQTIFVDLERQLNLLGGPIVLKITGYVRAGQRIPVVLESNLTTGYLWELTAIDTNYLVRDGKPTFEQKVTGIGAPSREMVYLKAVADGLTTITIRYRQPFDRGESPTRWIDMQAGDFPAEIDLTNPTSDQMALPSAPITSTIAGDLPEGSSNLSYPATFDWAAEGKVTSVRNQGACGSCWAFGTVGAMEAAIKIQTGQSVDLSEQFLVSCNNSGYSCNGGWWAHDYHTNRLANNQSTVGAVLESDMPYTATNGTCSAAVNHPYKLASWYSIAGYTVPSIDQIKTAISTYGPVSTAVCVGNGFASYSGGVFSTNETSACNGGVNHAVVLTGWDDASQTWVLRNSWGSSWGEGGYMRIKWGISNVGYASSYVVYNSGVAPTSTTGPSPTPTASPAPLINDDFNTPASVTLTNNSFTAAQTITSATSASDDPYFACVAGKGYKTVWYGFTPTTDGTVTINTLGSGYDTILAIWQGARTSLTSIACNDDYNAATTSQITANLTAGVPYFIEVAGYYSTSSGNLQLNLQYTPAPEPTITPTQTNTEAPSITPTQTDTAAPSITPTPSNTPAPTETPTQTFTVTNTPTATFTNTPTATFTNTPTSTYTNTFTPTHTYTPSNTATRTPTQTPTKSPLSAGTYDDSDARFVYVNWQTKKIGQDYGGSEHYSNRPGSTITVNFSGPGVVVIFRKDKRYGNVRVRIDGINYGVISQASTKQQFQQKAVFSGLRSNAHQMVLTHENGGTVTFDAIQVMAMPTATPTATRTPIPLAAGKYDDNHASILYKGYGLQTVKGSYNNTSHVSSKPGSTAVVQFNGTEITLFYRTQSGFGRTDVYIDGVYRASYLQNSSKTSYQKSITITGFGAGKHTLKLVHSNGKTVDFDAFTIR